MVGYTRGAELLWDDTLVEQSSCGVAFSWSSAPVVLLTRGAAALRYAKELIVFWDLFCFILFLSISCSGGFGPSVIYCVDS